MVVDYVEHGVEEQLRNGRCGLLCSHDEDWLVKVVLCKGLWYSLDVGVANGASIESFSSYGEQRGKVYRSTRDQVSLNIRYSNDRNAVMKCTSPGCNRSFPCIC